MRNLEAKFKLGDLQHARMAAEGMGYVYKATLHQTDTIFRAAEALLKLREEAAGCALICYTRENSKELKLSNYQIMQVEKPAQIRAILSQALGVIATVKKERVLLTRENLRLHLDRVNGLGDFGEIEAVHQDADDPERSRPAVEQLLNTLNVSRRKLIGASYFEMLRPLNLSASGRSIRK